MASFSLAVALSSKLKEGEWCIESKNTTIMEAVNETLQGGLSHLMEAATALAKLTDEAPLLSSRSHPKPRNISDGEFAEARLSSAVVRTTTKEIFPERLHAILNDTSLSDVISWLPHGQAFVIFRPDKFTETVLPKYLPPLDSRTSTKYPSFTRKLNRWYVSLAFSDLD